MDTTKTKRAAKSDTLRISFTVKTGQEFRVWCRGHDEPIEYAGVERIAVWEE